MCWWEARPQGDTQTRIAEQSLMGEPSEGSGPSDAYRTFPRPRDRSSQCSLFFVPRNADEQARQLSLPLTHNRLGLYPPLWPEPLRSETSEEEFLSRDAAPRHNRSNTSPRYQQHKKREQASAMSSFFSNGFATILSNRRRKTGKNKGERHVRCIAQRRQTCMADSCLA